MTMTAIVVAIRPAAADRERRQIDPDRVADVDSSPTGTTTATLRATIKDTNGNSLPGKTVTLAKGSGSSTITTLSGTTDALGQAFHRQ